MSDIGKNTQRRLDRYMRLVEISRDLASTLDLDALLNIIVNAAADVTDSTAASILLYDEAKHELYFQASTNIDTPLMKGLHVPIEGSIAGDVIKTRESIIKQREEDRRHFTKIGRDTKFATESLLAVPMIVQETVIGVVEALNKTAGKFNEEDQEILIALGSQAAVAIQNSRLFAQSDLIAEMVHELRTPLASISTASSLMTRKEISTDQRSTMAETIQRESMRLSEMTTSFLDLARLESGRDQFKIEVVDFKTILNDIVLIMKDRAEEKGLTLDVDIEKELPELHGDNDKLKQVALNFTSNAIKYNRPDGKITLGAHSSENDEIRFFVQDTGLGMAPEHVENLFQKFFRVPGSEDHAQGTGLGLSISKKIIEGHGGRIEVESEVNVGTTFIAMIPRNITGEGND